MPSLDRQQASGKKIRNFFQARCPQARIIPIRSLQRWYDRGMGRPSGAALRGKVGG